MRQRKVRTMNDIIDMESLCAEMELEAKDVCIDMADSIAEAIHQGHTKYDKGAFDRRSSHDRDGEFTGTDNWDHMNRIYDDGWVEGRERIAASLNGIYESNSTRNGTNYAIDYDVAGAVPDVPVAASGDVFCMFTPGDQERDSKPVMRILVELSASCSVPSSHIANRGAAVAALVDEIETGGVSCEIISSHTTTLNHWGGRSVGKMISTHVVVKRAGENVNVDDIAFGLGHPSMHRRVMFGMLETCSAKFKDEFTGNYGYPNSIPDESLPPDVMQLPSMKNDSRPYGSPEKAMGTVRNYYEKYCKRNGLCAK